jgi:hypothetical protein
MTKIEAFKTIKNAVENAAKSIAPITDDAFVVIIGVKPDYKFQRNYIEKVLYCSESQAKAIINEVKDVIDNRDVYVTYMYSYTANTPSSLVSPIAYQPR